MLTLLELESKLAADLQQRGLTNPSHVSLRLERRGEVCTAQWELWISQSDAAWKYNLPQGISVRGKSSDAVLRSAVAMLDAMLEADRTEDSLEVAQVVT